MYKYVLILFTLLLSGCTHIEIDSSNNSTNTICTIRAVEPFFITVPLQHCREKENWIVQNNTLFHNKDVQAPLLSFFYKQGAESNEEVLNRLFIKDNPSCSIRTLSTTQERTRLQIIGSGTTMNSCGMFTTMREEKNYFEFQGKKERFFFKHPSTTLDIDFANITITK